MPQGRQSILAKQGSGIQHLCGCGQRGTGHSGIWRVEWEHVLYDWVWRLTYTMILVVEETGF